MERYSAGDLARKFKVSVRTIQYYDRVDVLKAKIGENGRRYYYNKDILKLQQILFFKSLGFSLKEIRDKLLLIDNTDDFYGIFKQQRGALANKIDVLQHVVNMMDEAIEDIDRGAELDINRLVAISNLMNQNSTFSFVLNYFKKDELTRVILKYYDPSLGHDLTKRSEMLMGKMSKAYQEGVAPNSPEGQALAGEWWKMVTDFTENDPAILKRLFAIGRDVENWPCEDLIVKETISNFLMEVISIYFKSNGLEYLSSGQFSMEEEI